MNSYARKNPEEQPGVTPSPEDDHIAPAPRVSVQAFCETAETAAAVHSAAEDRRLGKAHLKVEMGGMAAAIEAYHDLRCVTNNNALHRAGHTPSMVGMDQACIDRRR